MSIDYKGRVINFMTKEQYHDIDKVDNELYAVEMPMVIDAGRSSDGTIWYRKWSDGWLEQGGYDTNNVRHNVTMIKHFADTKYCLNAHMVASESTETFHTMISDKTINSFVLGYGQYGNGNGTASRFSSVSWYACGQGGND